MAEPQDEAESIRRLIAETEALPKQELPGFASWAYNHPGILTSRTKDPRQYDQDVRRAHFLERLRKDHRDYAHNQGLFHLGGRGSVEALRSPYQPYSGDDPLSNAGRWMQSLPAAVYATGQMAANEFNPQARPYPQAYDDYAKNVNNFVVFGEPLGVNKNHMRDMADMREREASMPWQQIVPQEHLDEARAIYGLLASPKTGTQYLNEAGIHGPVASVWGNLMDAVVDPLYSPARTLKGVAVDYGPSVGPTMAMEAWRASQNARPSY